MIDRDQLREALLDYPPIDYPTTTRHGLSAIVEAARLVADPDTLIITKVDGEWPLPGEAWRVLNTAAALGHPGGSIPLANDLLDALLEVNA